MKHAIATVALTALATLTAGLAPAQEVPLLYDVTGGETVAVRENPRATARKLAELPATAAAVEITELSESGEWGRVNAGEMSGWVTLGGLTARAGLARGASYFDGPLSCHGTEPFWGLTQGDTPGFVLTRPADPEVALATVTTLTSSNEGPFSQAMIAGAPELTLTATLRRGICTDGMSDRSFGLTLDMLVEREGGPTLYSGCCSLTAP